MASAAPATRGGKCDRFEAAYLEYVRELDDARHELMRTISEAQHDLRQARLRCRSDSDDKDQVKMSDDHCGAICRAWEAWQERVNEAYRTFLEAFGTAWDDTDWDDLDPPALAAIAQGLVAVAGHGAATIGNLDVFAATGVRPPADAMSSSRRSGRPPEQGDQASA
jgi:uncharacterized protein (DUF4415 family)